MMMVTLQTNCPLKPTVSLYGDTIKIDLGVLLLEVDRLSFNEFVYDVASQVSKQGTQQKKKI